MTDNPGTTRGAVTPAKVPGDTGAKGEFAAGARAMTPMMLGYLPFGLMLGAAVGRSTQPWAAWVGTELIYGGSAHLTLIEMLRTGSGWWAAVGAALLINARLLVYSSALIPLWGSARMPARLLAAAVVIDPTWMLAGRRAAEGGTTAHQRSHFAGAAVVLTAGFTAAVTVGAQLGSATSVTGVLAIAVPLCLVAIVVPHLRVPGGIVAVVAAVGTTAATASWPTGSGMLAAMAAAAVCGALASGRPGRPA